MPTKKESQTASMYIGLNKTHLSNVAFAKSTRLIKLFSSFSELDSLIFWGSIFHIFGPKCLTD